MRQSSMNKFFKIFPVLLAVILLVAFGFWHDNATGENEEKTTASTSQETSKKSPKNKKTFEKQLQKKGDQLAEEYPNSLEYRVYDIDAQQTYQYSNEEEERQYETASIVKVAVAMLLLHQKEQAQEELSEAEEERMSSMILSSDNEATSALLNESLGGFGSLQTIFDEFGMENTTVNLANWGNTTTTAEDQMKLLKELYFSSEYLSEESQDYIIHLMTQIDDDQSWGVYAGSDDVSFKNGWLTTEGESGEWVITSIGKVSDGDHAYLAVALSDGNPSVEEGSHVIEELVKLTSDYLL